MLTLAMNLCLECQMYPRINYEEVYISLCWDPEGTQIAIDPDWNILFFAPNDDLDHTKFFSVVRVPGGRRWSGEIPAWGIHWDPSTTSFIVAGADGQYFTTEREAFEMAVNMCGLRDDDIDAMDALIEEGRSADQ